MLNEGVPAQFDDFESAIVTNYVIRTTKLQDLEPCLKNLGARTRRVWPYFQKYWPEQMTESVKTIRDQFLLVDMDSISEEKIAVLRSAAQLSMGCRISV